MPVYQATCAAKFLQAVRQIHTGLRGRFDVLRKGTPAALSALLVLCLLGTQAVARDTPVKVVLDGRYWFCHTNPSGWTVGEFEGVCTPISAGGVGEFVEFYVDRKGKVRRKPPVKKKASAGLGLRGTL